MSRKCPGVVPVLSRCCPGVVPVLSRRCPGPVPLASDWACFAVAIECLYTQQHECSRGLQRRLRFRCQTEGHKPWRKKTTKIKEIPAPEGCVLCGGLKGSAAALATGTLRPPVSVRGTLTKSAGRPRRRSRWEWPPRLKATATTKAKGRPRAAFCFGAGLSRRRSLAAVRSTRESSASPSEHCSCVSATPARLP